MSIVNGFHDSIKMKILDKDFHLQVYHRDDMLENYENIANKISKIKHVKHAFPFHDGKAIIKYENEKSGIIVRGYMQEMFEKDKSFAGNFKIIKGKVSFNKTNRIIIGDNLAQKLGAKVGNIIELFVDMGENSASFNFAVKRFKVSGIFNSGYGDFDKNIVFISLRDAQKLYNYESDFFGIKGYKAWGIGVKLDNPDNYQAVSEKIIALFPELRIRNYEQLNGNLLYAFQWEKKLMMVVLIIMVIATVLTVMLILTVVVMDKKKEIGILKSFGVKHKVIKNIFLVEGFLISFIGTICGLILGIVLTVYIKEIAVFIEYVVNVFLKLIKNTWIADVFGIHGNISRWEIVSSSSMYSRSFPYKLMLSDFLILSIMTFFWSLIGALLPANKAVKITVVEAIRHE